MGLSPLIRLIILTSDTRGLMHLWRVLVLVGHNMTIVSTLRSWLMAATCIYYFI
jgi:hypothetical protein